MGIIGAVDLVRSGMYVIASMLAGVLTDKLVSTYLMTLHLIASKIHFFLPFVVVVVVVVVAAAAVVVVVVVVVVGLQALLNYHSAQELSQLSCELIDHSPHKMLQEKLL